MNPETEQKLREPEIPGRERETKEELNRRAPFEYGISVAIGVSVIILLAVAAYYGLTH